MLLSISRSQVFVTVAFTLITQITIHGADALHLAPSAEIRFQANAGRPRPPVITSIALAPDENHLAAVGDDHFVRIVDTRSRKQIEMLEGHTDWIRSVAFGRDGEFLATAGNDRRIIIWNTSNWSIIDTLPQPAAIHQVAFSPDGMYLASVGFDEFLRVYSISTGWTPREFQSTCQELTCVAFSPEDDSVFAAGRDGEIRSWNLNTNERLWSSKVTHRRIRSLAVSATGRNLAVAGDDQTVHLRRTSDGSELHSLNAGTGKTFAVRFCGPNLLAQGRTTNDVTILSVESNRVAARLRGHVGSITSLAYSANKRQLYSASFDTKICVWDLHQALPNQVAIGEE